ncbi:hypothetical protein LOTGIDRAFT_231944 [Lottia gigantea]|uniref:Chitin-binding type-2 domain-containing protein n=1 Tax=Lottia gigantea TaxID=225164 RepID=V4AFS9_LOTGI|nr:hypothetical protein LOTGIDRAFT_231944 [Lottia gigantea]ESO95757.1 hypothetical protein LOTGIDRAFT_231944 [Lottia gigantea]
MYSSLVAVLLMLVVGETLATNCGGVQNKYVCHPTNPTIFVICIGEQVYTMRCPGGLHFNSRTQTCDWPKNAFCGTLRQPKVTQTLTEPSGQSNINSVASNKREENQRRVTTVAPTQRKLKPAVYQKDDRGRYTVKIVPTPTPEVTTSTQTPSKSKWTLARYPWWAAKSPATRPTLRASVPAITKATTRGPELRQDGQPVINNVPVRPGLDVTRYTPRQPDRNNAPRAPNSVAAGPPKIQPANKKESIVTSTPRTTKFKPTKTAIDSWIMLFSSICY